MFTSTTERSALLCSMRAYLSTATAPQRIENIANRLTGVSWRDLDDKNRRIVAGMMATCGWKRGKWPHWTPAGPIAPPDAAPQPVHAGRDRWGAAIEPERAAA
jgi:hypothetical protein